MPEDAITQAITSSLAEATDNGTIGDSNDGTADSGDSVSVDTPDLAATAASTDGATDSGSGVAAGVDTGTAVDATAGDAAKPTEPVEPVEDEFATEHGIKSKDTAGRENKIPFSRVKKINENAVKKAKTGWEAEILAPERAKVTEYEARLKDISVTEDVLFNHPEQFLDQLRTVPGYETLLPAKGKAAAAATEPTGAAIDWSKAPGADTETGYSNKGLTDLLSWTVQQATAQAVAATEKKLSERYAPMETAFTRTQQSREQQRAQFKATDDIIGHAAEHWPQFKENHEAITKILVDDAKANSGTAKMAPRAALESAYHKVVFGKLSTDRNKVREEVLAELKSAPKSTAVGSGVGVAKAAAAPPEGVDPIEWTIRQSAARLK